jgi:hypothetical protein
MAQNEETVELVRRALSRCATSRGYRLRDERDPLARAVVGALGETGKLRPEPDPLRELAEWLVSLDDCRDLGTVEKRTAAMGEAIARARQALGKED